MGQKRGDGVRERRGVGAIGFGGPCILRCSSVVIVELIVSEIVK
jgi:hypothetical protein